MEEINVCTVGWKCLTWVRGNCYVVFQHRIWKVRPDYSLQLLAGSRRGFADGHRAEAQFDTVLGMCPWKKGLLVADAGNNRIRRVTLEGTVTTFAGDGVSQSSDSPARFARPRDIRPFGRNSALVTEWPSGRVRLVRESGVTTLSEGTPYLKCFARVRDGWWCTAAHRVMELTDGLWVVAGSPDDLGANYKDGVGAEARFTNPLEMLATTDGALVADYGNNSLRHVSFDGTVTTVAGNGTDHSALNGVHAIGWTTGGVLIAGEATRLVKGFQPYDAWVHFPPAEFIAHAWAAPLPPVPFTPLPEVAAWGRSLRKDTLACAAALYLGSGRGESTVARLRWETGACSFAAHSGSFGQRPVRAKIVAYLVPPLHVRATVKALRKKR